MRIGFLNNQIDNRGTGNALYDYAHYNEEILGNKSLIFTLTYDNAVFGMWEKLVQRFGRVDDIRALFGDGWKEFKLDALYHIKYGQSLDAITIPGAAYLVHAVFDGSQPHGDAYAAVSRWLGERHQIPWVPHIIDPKHGVDNLRERLGIPETALVFGRHGGRDTFDIPWVWNAIINTLRTRDDVYFLFLNTDVPEGWLKTRWSSHIISLPNTVDPEEKWAFIRSCDAMLHARERGETFGIAVGEFDVIDKPVITYGLSPEQAHYQQLDQPIYYFSPEGLRDILVNWERVISARSLGDWRADRWSYVYCTPEYVMFKFKEVFLNADTWNRNRASPKRSSV